MIYATVPVPNMIRKMVKTVPAVDSSFARKYTMVMIVITHIQRASIRAISYIIKEPIIPEK